MSGHPGERPGRSRPEANGAGPTDDPVRARRRQIARWSLLANRIGYLCFGVAIAVFVFGFAIGFTPATVSVVVVEDVEISIIGTLSGGGRCTPNSGPGRRDDCSRALRSTHTGGHWAP